MDKNLNSVNSNNEEIYEKAFENIVGGNPRKKIDYFTYWRQVMRILLID